MNYAINISGIGKIVNVALNKPVEICSFLLDPATLTITKAENLVDGNHDPEIHQNNQGLFDFGLTSCIHTNSELHPWAYVDLTMIYNIHYVLVVNRADPTGA